MNIVIPTKASGETVNEFTAKKDTAVTVVTSNVTLEGEQIQNGVNLVAGNRVLLTGQTDKTENGLHLVGSGVYGPWTRPADFNTGSEAAGTWTYIEQGTEHAGTIWFCYTNRTCTIDTDEQEWRNVNEDPVGGFDASDLLEESTNSALDYLSKHNGTGMRKIKRNDLLLPGIKPETYSYGSMVTINLADPERNFTVVLTGDTTLLVLNAKPGAEFNLKIIQDGTGGHALTWFDTINWAGGSAPTLTPTADRADWFHFICTQSNTYDCRYYSQNYGDSVGAGEALTEGIVSYWKLDETSGNRLDSVGNHDMIEVGTTHSIDSYVGPGILGNSLGYSFLDNYLRVPNHNDFNPTNTDFSISLWFSPLTSANESQSNLLSKGTLSPSSGQYYLRHENNAIQFNLTTDLVSIFNDNNRISLYDVAADNSGWHHLCAVVSWSEGLMKLAIDGGTFTTKAITGTTLKTTTRALNLAVTEVDPSTIAYRYEGRVDEVGFWNKALSSAEKDELYNSGAAKAYPFT